MTKVNGTEIDGTPMYNMKAVVTQTGLNPTTIRAWERRYGLPLPQRTAGGHRQYSQRDVEALKWLVARQEEGISISHAVELWQSYVDRGEDPLQTEVTENQDPVTQVAFAVDGGKIDQLRQAWISACLNFDRRTAEQILATSFALFSAETVCVEVLQKGLAEVGNGWYAGEVTVQQEHFTSALSVRRLEMLVAATPSPTRPERIVVATAPGDYHVFSPLLLTFLLRQRGWDVIYLGANVPAVELESTIEQIRPDLLIVSAQLLHTAATLKELSLVAQSKDVTFAFGGLVFNEMPELRRLVPGHYLGESLEDAVRWVAQSMKQQLPTSRWSEPSDTYQRALAEYTARRASIESHVRDAFNGNGKLIGHLSSMNRDLAQTIEAALELGDVRLLNNDISWIEYLMMGYRLPSSLIADYLSAYYQAAATHLEGAANMIVEWLSQIASVQSD